MEGRGCCLSMLYRFYDSSLQVMDAETFFEKSIIGGAWGWVIRTYARATGFLREACFAEWLGLGGGGNFVGFGRAWAVSKLSQ